MTDKEILDTYERTGSMRATAKELHVYTQVIRRVLITHGVYTSPMVEQVEEMASDGKSIDEIAQALHVTRAWVISSTPYTRGSYRIGDKTVNARRIAKCRERKNKNDL